MTCPRWKVGMTMEKLVNGSVQFRFATANKCGGFWPRNNMARFAAVRATRIVKRMTMVHRVD